MKQLIIIFYFLFTTNLVFAQPYIHAHNDYQQPQPLVHAIENKVFSLEADLFLVKGKLRVAHDKKELDAAPKLKSLYLKPIIKLFKKHRGRISADSAYAPVLMLDIKQDGAAVIAAIVKAVKNHRQVFDRNVNPMAVQIVISGDRGVFGQWTSYPSYIFFDGRPHENYDAATLQRVAFISDAYKHYAKPADSTAYKLQQLSAQVHQQNKLLRVWGMPDDYASWKQQMQWGIDIINTDKVFDCKAFFNSKFKSQNSKSYH